MLGGQTSTEPKTVHLASAGSFTQLALEEGGDLHVGQLDIASAFYMISFPKPRRAFFGLRVVRAGDEGLTSVSGGSVRPQDMVVPSKARGRAHGLDTRALVVPGPLHERGG